MKKMKILLGSLAVLSIFIISGPVPEVDDRLEPINLSSDLDQYLESGESRWKELKPNTEKKINWIGEKGKKTKNSLVYIHGFSASRQEIAPVPELIAKNLEANYFATRLTGHGLPGAYMKEGNVHTWLNDGAEAIEIGRNLGENVFVIGVSTGATILAALLSKPEYSDVRGAAFVSPNFSPRDKNARILTFPWGSQLVKLIIGKERVLKNKTEEGRLYWTTSYPSEVLCDMMALVEYTKKSSLENTKTPILFYYHQDDGVISPEEVQRVKARLKPEIVSEILVTEPTEDSSNHVITGRIMAPGQVEKSVKEISDFFLRVGSN